MKTLLPVFLALVLSVSFANASFSILENAPQNFVRCLSLYSNNATAISQRIFTSRNSSFNSIWEYSVNNVRWNDPSSIRPLVIVTPVDESQVRTVVYCAKKEGLDLRIRGSGHDFEGLSYTNPTPLAFVMMDMINMKAIHVDVSSKTATVQGGATLGEVYYRISQKTNTLGFPGGTWGTVGASGVISGGGYGFLMRKYGLAVDYVLDIRVMDSNGRVYNRKTMGEDVFWALRGGGASSFGVILEWKLQLVPVPDTVTLFFVNRTIEQGATNLLNKWQYVAPAIDRDLQIRVQLSPIYVPGSRKKTVNIMFEGFYLGKIDTLLPLMEKSFPELGVTKELCNEMTYIQSILVFSALSRVTPPQILLDRPALVKLGVEGKSDFVRKPIPIKGWEGLWKRFLKNDLSGNFVMNPYGGAMDDFSESATPFPNRKGTLFMMLEEVFIDVNTAQRVRAQRYQWIREVNRYLAPYVSQNPRRAYVNYNDLDLGVGAQTYEEANIWGSRYFHNNFKRLVQVKTKFDPMNFFKHPQSIPSFPVLSSDM